MHEYCDKVNRIKIQYVTINAEDNFKINILPVSREYHGLQEVSGTNRSFGHRTPNSDGAKGRRIEITGNGYMTRHRADYVHDNTTYSFHIVHHYG